MFLKVALATAERALDASSFGEKPLQIFSLDIFRNLWDLAKTLFGPLKSQYPSRNLGYGYPCWLLESAKKNLTITIGELLTLVKISQGGKLYSSSGQHQAWSNWQSRLIAVWDTKGKWSDSLVHCSTKAQFPGMQMLTSMMKTLPGSGTQTLNQTTLT